MSRIHSIVVVLLLCVTGAAAGSGIAWVVRPDPADTCLPRTKDLVLTPTDAGLTVQIKTNRHPGNTFAPGDKVRAIVRVSEDAFVYLLGVDAAWDVAQIFPGKAFTRNRLEKGREHPVPPERGDKVGYYRPDRAGRQYLIAVAALAELDLGPLLPALRERRGDFDAALAAFAQALERARPGCALASCAMTIDDAPKTVALVIGCGAYRSGPLPAAAADARAVASYLERAHGSHLALRTLVDPDRAQIVEALGSWLPAAVRKGDGIFFYYSGHGTSVKDADGDEPDGLDEALVPTDYRPVRGIDWDAARRQLIVDDDLHRWIAHAARGGARQAILVFDACHSGTAQRGIAAAPSRSGPQPKVFFGLFETDGGAPVEPPRVMTRAVASAGSSQFDDSAARPGSEAATPWGVIAACRDDEISWAGESLSLMTAHLLAGLAREGGRAAADANGDGTVTVREISAYARERVKQYVDENRERLSGAAPGGRPDQTVTTLRAGDGLPLDVSR